jgi:hypothetical protein
MNGSARDEYIATLDPVFAPAVRSLDAAIMSVRFDFEARVAYGILLYALGRDFRHWVCAVDCGRPGAKPQAVHVRFLYGSYMSDPHGVLRAGTSHLRTIDFSSVDEIDIGLVTEYVTAAAAGHDGFVKAEGA